MTFDDWWDEWQGKASQRFTYNDRVFAEEAWDHQKARIDALTAALREIGNGVYFMLVRAQSIFLYTHMCPLSRV